MKGERIFLLSGLADVIRWLEHLVFLLSGPMLTFACAVSVMDLLEHGSLLLHNPGLLVAWSAAMAISLDASLPASFERVRDAIERRKWWQVLGWLVLGAYLGWMVFLSIEAFSYEQAQGISESVALAQLGIAPTAWMFQRSLLAVVLAALAGFNRIRPKVKSKADEVADLKHELEVTPLKNQLAALKAGGAVQVAKAAMGAPQSKPKSSKGTKAPPSSPFPTGPGTPLLQPLPAATQGNDTSQLVPLESGETEHQRRAARARLTTREKAYRALDEFNGELTKTQLAKRLRVSESRASALKRQWAADKEAVAL